MAIIPTSSNTTNIANLPQSQLAVGTDLLILQTSAGTSVITFDNFNAVKTDVYGNATVTGNLTAGNSTFNSVNTVSITAFDYATAYGSGTTLANDYYDSFTIQNGIVLSATLTSLNYSNNPIYTNSMSNLTAVSATVYVALSGVSAQISALSTLVATTSATLYSDMQGLTSAATFNSVLSAGTGITLTENDAANALTVAAPYAASAYVVFGIPSGYKFSTNGGTDLPANYIYNSYNVTAVTYVTNGHYIIHIAPGVFTNNRYVVQLTSSSIAAGNTPSVYSQSPNYAPPLNMTTTQCEVVNGFGDPSAFGDPGYFAAVFFGN